MPFCKKDHFSMVPYFDAFRLSSAFGFRNDACDAHSSTLFSSLLVPPSKPHSHLFRRCLTAAAQMFSLQSDSSIASVHSQELSGPCVFYLPGCVPFLVGDLVFHVYRQALHRGVIISSTRPALRASESSRNMLQAQIR